MYHVHSPVDSVLQSFLEGVTDPGERKRIKRIARKASGYTEIEAQRKSHELECCKQKASKFFAGNRGKRVLLDVARKEAARMMQIASLKMALRFYERYQNVTRSALHDRETTIPSNSSSQHDRASRLAEASSYAKGESSSDLSNEADDTGITGSSSEGTSSEDEEDATDEEPNLEYNSSTKPKSRVHSNYVATSQYRGTSVGQVSKASSLQSPVQPGEAVSDLSIVKSRSNRNGITSAVSRLKLESPELNPKPHATENHARLAAVSPFKLPPNAVQIKIEDDSEDESPSTTPRPFSVAEPSRVSLAVAGRERAYQLNVAHKDGYVEVAELEAVLREHDRIEGHLRYRNKVLTFLSHYDGITDTQIERAISKTGGSGCWDAKVEEILGRKRTGDAKDGGPLRKKRKSRS